MTRYELNRRTLLRAGGQAALLAALWSRPALGAPKFLDDPFSMGVASGDPAPDGFVIWTRLAPKPLEPHGGMPAESLEVGWEVAEDEGFRRIVQAGKALARPELAHSVHVEIAGLGDRRRYWYRFVVDGIASDVGTARTAPLAGAALDRLRIAVAGCQHYERGLFTAWRHISQEPDLDLVYHYGDYIYEGKSASGAMAGDAPVVRRTLGDELYSLDDYRLRYATYKTDADLRAAHAAAAFLPTFDDHEVENDWAGDLDAYGTPAEVFLLRRAAAMQAWYEHMPVRMAQFPYRGAPTAYRRLDFGRLVRVHLLDKRSYRSIRLCERDRANCVNRRDTPDTMLGDAQERWLGEGLGNHARWNMLAVGGLVMPFDRSMEKDPNRGYDNWNGYPDARQRLVQMIQSRGLKNVVITGGDSHEFFIGDLPSRRNDLQSPPVAAELHATSISSTGAAGIPRGPDPRIATNPHISLIHDQRGYLMLDVDTQAVAADLRVIDLPLQPGGGVSTLARYVVRPDRPGAIRI